MFLEDSEKLKTHGLLGNKWKLSFKILLLFIFLFSSFIFLSYYILYGKFLCHPALIMSLMTNFLILTITDFGIFGEEYGWRTYFQPLLQRKFGLRMGVLVFAMMWELWHLPATILFLGPQALSMGYASLGQYICMRLVHEFSLAIFLAYAYMKTENFWLAVMIHNFSNAFALTLMSVFDEWYCGDMTWTMFGIRAGIELAVFVPFLFSKVFRKPVEAETEAKAELAEEKE